MLVAVRSYFCDVFTLSFFLWRVKKRGEKSEGGSKSVAFVNVEGERLKRNEGEVRVLLMINWRSKRSSSCAI